MHTSSEIRERMDVVGADGSRIGTVDRVEGQTIKLAQDDPVSHGAHHWIPMDWVQSVDQVVHLNKRSDEATRNWQTAAPAVPKM